MRKSIADSDETGMMYMSKKYHPPTQKQTDKVKKVLAKNAQLRNHADNQIILEFINSNLYLEKLTEQISTEFVKNLLKSASIVELNPKRVLYQEDAQIDYVYVLLEGCVAVKKRQQQFITNLQQEDTVYRLINFAVSYVKQLKKNHISSKYTQEQFNLEFKSTTEQIPTEDIEKYYHSQQSCGFYDLSCQNRYLFTTITTQKSLILAVSKRHFMLSLQQAFKQKTVELIEQLKGIPSFGFLQVEKIKSIIQSLNFKKKKRGDFIYEQRTPVNSLYFLSKGEIKITKQTHLFQENPNSFYMDRVKLLDDLYKIDAKSMDRLQRIQTQRKKKQAILPYANLTSLYNYEPVKKEVDIGVLSPFCLFGEEQCVEGRNRQTTALCHSLQVEYYEIQLKKVRQIIGSKQINQFMKYLKNSTRRKVLYRQNQYAAKIDMENKNNLDYFYYDGDKEKQASKRYKIFKVNEKMKPQNSSTEFTKSQEQNVPAYYTSFNFHKLIKNKQKKEQPTEEEQNEEKQNPVERKLMNISHTWKLMEKKVDMERKTSRKISPQKHAINLKKPLIQAQYFYHIDKEKRRIEREYRKRVLSLGRKHVNKSTQG